ncbi:MAG: T9SS type A sorting domain-containing protein [Flavobacteriaceae bacterium]|nr:T9SS type A sorting domain-containing protein [Flavobacteriaceae bacterium]
MKRILLLVALSFSTLIFAQDYTEYITGSTTDVNTNHQPGICLMGGSSENDEAMVWFLNKADGGDVVVLRASGDDGYNNYFYSELGVTLNSVTTLVINNTDGATDPYVLQKVANAEAIWVAGGDQWDYVSYFKDNAMETTLNEYINIKHGVIGGTSAGMAIMGSTYFTAQYGTLESNVALSNPYHPRVALGYNDFLELPFMQNLITDTHFTDRDRQGRISVFLARFIQDNGPRSFGIACNDYTAVCVEPDGKAFVYGEYPDYPEYAYFLQANCVTEYAPEVVVAGTPVTWNRNGEAIKVYKVPGTYGGPNYFDLSDWETGTGGSWENWFIENGTLSMEAGENPNCGQLAITNNDTDLIGVYPNPFTDELFIESKLPLKDVGLFDVLGCEIKVEVQDNFKIETTTLSAGTYILKIQTEKSQQTFKLIKNSLN